jgi:hypothetical protein
MKTILSIVLVPLLTVWPIIAAPAPDSLQTLQVHAVPDEGSASNQGFTVHVTDDTGAPVADAAVLMRLPDSGPTGTFGDGTHASVGYSDTNGQAHFSGIQWSAEHGTVPVTITASKGAAHAGTLVEHAMHPDISEPAPETPAPVAPPTQPAVAPKVKAQITEGDPAGPAPAPAKIAAVTPQPGIIAKPQAVLPNASAETPSVSVVNGATHEKLSPGTGSSHKKWYILAAIIAGGAGAGVAMMGKKSSSSSSVAPPTITIGSPSVSVGHP